jgi:hypothetical protein
MKIDIVYIKNYKNIYKLKFLNGRYKGICVTLSSLEKVFDKCRDIYQQTFFIKIFKNYIGFCKGRR